MNINKNIDEKIKANLKAQKNQEDCPTCGAGCYIPATTGHILGYAHDCRCLQNLLLDKDVDLNVRLYAKYCHQCGRPDGVNNTLPECTPDPPYQYRCKYCGHSLRTHHEYGQERQFDLEYFGIKWRFNEDRKPMLIFPSQNI